MIGIDLNDMSLENLKALQKSITKAISGFAEKKKAEARAEIEALARQHGFSVTELLGTPYKQKRSSVSDAKYRNPADPSATWTGRGRKPNWIKDGLAAGKSLDDFAI